MPFPSAVGCGSGSTPSRRVSGFGDIDHCADVLLSDAMVALSALSEAHPRRPLLEGRRGHFIDFDALSDWQCRSAARLRRILGARLGRRVALGEREALADLVKCDDLYLLAGGGAKNLGSYDIKRLRVVRADLSPQEVADLTSEEAAGRAGPG